MNRQTILASVHRQLRESFAETGEVRPLGEIVPRVAQEIRVGGAGAPAVSHGLVPIEKVAAFVDGHLDPAEAETICEAVMTDNSVLAEIIAAVRATQESIDQLPPLSKSLAAQIQAMHATHLDDRSAGTAHEAAAPQIELRPTPAAEPSARSSRLPTVTAILAIAATIIAAVILIGRGDHAQPDREFVAENDGPPGTSPDLIPKPEAEISQQEPPRDPTEGLADTAPQDAAMPRDPDSPTTIPSNRPERSEPIVTAVPKETLPSVPQDQVAKDQSMPDLDPEPASVPDPPPIAQPPRMASVRWTEVSGLMAQRNETSQRSGSRSGPTWRRIQEGSPSSRPGTTAVAVRTLPFSRASGELGVGGRVVVSGDTALQILPADSDDAIELDLMYGAVAMVDLAAGATVKFRQGQETIAMLRWQDKASAVIQRFAAGLQIQIEGGEIEVNQTAVRNKSVRVNNQAVETVRAPRRLPGWVAKPIEMTAEDRMILAQIAETDDLSGSLNRRIMELSSSPTLRRGDAYKLTRLANWQAAMAGPALFRLAGSRVPAVRLAALQRLSMLSENDPRYQRVWSMLDRAVDNPQRSMQMRNWFRLMRAGAQPNQAQLEQMALGLSSHNMAGRALCDFMLRKYVRNPPPFDPSWTGQKLQRAVSVYRARAGLPDRVRPNAAAAGNRS